MAENTGRTTPETPVVYREAGVVFKNRGQETHGVPMTGTPDVADEVQGSIPVLVHEEPPPPDPVPVTIVRTGGRELVRSRVQRAYAGTDVSQIIGRNEARNKVIIRNLSTDTTVWIAEGQHIANPSFGYPIPANSDVTITSETEVFASIATGSTTNPVPLALLVEHVIKEN